MKKKGKIFLTLFITFFILINGHSQTMPKSFFEASSGKLKYGFYVPENFDSTKVYPLIMFLHGFSNDKTVYLDWYKSEIQGKNPCFVYTPKTPPTWANWSGWNDYTLSESMLAALKVLDSLSKKYAIDTTRLYVYGISMGGEGVFDLLHKLPGKFAAAMSVCGGGQAWWAYNITKTPLWMFHGSADNVNPPIITERVYYTMLAMGAKKMRYTNYPGFGHYIDSKAASEPSWHDWMFTFSTKDTTSCPKPNKPITLSDSINNKLALSWNDVRNPDEKANKIWYYTINNSKGSVASVEFNKTFYNFSPANPIDTFQVNAVNYCFEKSELSNAISYKSNNINTDLPSVNKPIAFSITKNDNQIIIENSNEITESEIVVEIVSIDGKLLFRKKTTLSDKLSIDISSYNESVLIAIVKQNNMIITKKIITK